MRLVLAAFLIPILPLATRADLVVGYAVSGNTNPIPPTTTASGVTALNLSRGAGLTPGTATTDFVGAHWTGESTDYFEFGFSASTTPWDLSQIQLRTNRSGTGPTSIDVQASFNGGAFTSVGGFSPPESQANFIVDLSAYDAITSAVFRLFGSGASGTAGSFRIEDNGNFLATANDLVIEAVAVPEPSAFLFGLLVCMAMGVASKSRVSAIVRFLKLAIMNRD